MLKVFTSESKGSFIPWGLPEREVWHVKQNVLANDINRQYFPMSIFSTLESSSFHNSIPNLMYVSRRFCIHVILSWRPKNCTGALKNWNLGEKNLYTAYLWSQNHTIYLPLNQVWCMSRKESLSYYIDQTMLALLIDWYTN